MLVSVPKQRPRLAISLLLALAIFGCLPGVERMATKFLISWDTGTFFYLVLATLMMSRSSHEDIKKRAGSQDENSIVILALTILGALASIVAIMQELVSAKTLTGSAESHAIILAAVTVILSWFFMQTIFALHYAHAFYDPDRGDLECGLEFPAKFTTPDYWDFIYFSFIIGTAAQTADINITSKTIRRIVTLQCISVFFYNTTILALAINIGAGLAA